MHPSKVLFQGKRQPAAVPACDHYAGSEKLMRKSMALQQELGPLSTSPSTARTAPPPAARKQHARLVASLVMGEDNRHGRIGARVHDIHSPFSERDVALDRRRCKPPGLPGAAQGGQPGRREHGLAVIAGHAEQPAATRPAGPRADRNPRRAGGGARSPPCPRSSACRSASWTSCPPITAPFPAARCARPASSPMRWWRAPSARWPPPAMRTAKCPSHNVTTEIRDASVVAQDAARAFGEFGFTRMWSIHPSQIRPILRPTRPAGQEVADAAAILVAAQAAQWGPTQYQGACMTAPAIVITGRSCSVQDRRRAAASGRRSLL